MTLRRRWPFPTFRPASPHPAVQHGHLYPNPLTAPARWLMDPGKNIPPAIREAFAHDIYISTPTVFIAVISLLVINILYVHFMATPFAWALLGWNIAISAARVGLTHAIFARPGPKRRILTDAYLFMLLLWCLTQGVLAGFAEASNIATLQVLAANSALALQGPLCARNYPLPRLCKLLLLGLTIPWVIGGAVARNHWLLTLAVYAPTYLAAAFATIDQFLDTAQDAQAAKLASDDQARHDPLTGALNRLGMADALQASMTAAQPFAIFSLDLDGFKAVNDSFGHPAGDALLREVTARLQNLIRPGDKVARPGGDEFIIIAHGMRPAACAPFAARLVDAISQHEYQLEGGVIARVGVSVGYACSPDDGTQLNTIQRHADAALYAAKQRRKQAVLF
jgi:diguanylate cyclase (GGDEF)-like protein